MLVVVAYTVRVVGAELMLALVTFSQFPEELDVTEIVVGVVALRLTICDAKLLVGAVRLTDVGLAVIVLVPPPPDEQPVVDAE
jgi:hypothetical protein